MFLKKLIIATLFTFVSLTANSQNKAKVNFPSKIDFNAVEDTVKDTSLTPNATSPLFTPPPIFFDDPNHIYGDPQELIKRQEDPIYDNIDYEKRIFMLKLENSFLSNANKNEFLLLQLPKTANFTFNKLSSKDLILKELNEFLDLIIIDNQTEEPRLVRIQFQIGGEKGSYEYFLVYTYEIEEKIFETRDKISRDSFNKLVFYFKNLYLYVDLSGQIFLVKPTDKINLLKIALD